MAGAFTHLMVCQVAAQSPDLAGLPELLPMLNSFRGSMLFGALCPDLPSLSIPEKLWRGENRSWANYIHKNATNGIVIEGAQDLYAKRNNRGKGFEAKLAWLFGYASHLIIDATIHPIVEAIVGPYEIEDNQIPHSICEITQDAIIFKEIEGKDIAESKYIPNSIGRPHDEIFEYWKSLILKAYFPNAKLSKRSRRTPAIRPPEMIEGINGIKIRKSTLLNSISPSRWSDWYSFLLAEAVGGKLMQFSRHIGLGKDYAYPIASEILSNNREIYYDSVKLPPTGDKTGPFFIHGFEYAVKNVISGWKVLYAGVTNGKDVSGFFKNWDLDTGIDRETGRKTFWA